MRNVRRVAFCDRLAGPSVKLRRKLRRCLACCNHGSWCQSRWQVRVRHSSSNRCISKPLAAPPNLETQQERSCQPSASHTSHELNSLSLSLFLLMLYISAFFLGPGGVVSTSHHKMQSFRAKCASSVKMLFKLPPLFSLEGHISCHSS